MIEKGYGLEKLEKYAKNPKCIETEKEKKKHINNINKLFL